MRPPSSKKSFTLVSCYIGSGVMVLFIVLMLAAFLIHSLPAWRGGVWDLLAGTEWYYRSEKFGMLSMIYGSAVVSLIAILFAAPLGIGAAVYTAEIAGHRWRMIVKGIIELLAGVPSVIYGILGILFLREWVRRGFDLNTGDTLLTAGLLVGVMILPTVVTLCDDALRAVPRIQRDAARGLGMTRSEMIFSVLVPQAGSGMMAAVLLALGRGVGETIAVMLVVGRQDNQLPASIVDFDKILEPGQTLTSKLGGSEVNIAFGDPGHWGAITALALVLLLGVMVITVLGRFLVHYAEKRGGVS
ncbi:hypothetical protein NT6N_32870 [Oceaniferula spumae]|uniref:Phosphate transport system permease protein n=1 Tax=Oceaniferula spumae TaxID=2979115 RepID=A0AAT9FQJ0_9BACT